MYRWLIISLGLMLTGQCQGQICVEETTTLFLASKSISALCTTYEWKFKATRASNLFVQWLSADLTKDDHCKVYRGTNSSGELIGRIDQYQIGPVLCSCSKIFASCYLENAGAGRILAHEYFPDRCGTTIIETLDEEITSAGHPADYAPGAICIWNYNSPHRRKFVFDFSSFDYEDTFDFLYIIPDDNDSPRLKTTGNLDPFLFETEGNGFQIVTVSDVGGVEPGFAVDITKRPPDNPEVSCQTQIKIKLDNTKLSNLTYESGDALYISNNRQNDLGSISGSCKADGSSPVFFFNLTECEATYLENDGRLNTTFSIWNFKAMDPSHYFQRFVSYNLNITCDFNASYALQSVFIKPQIQQIGTARDSLYGEFEISFNVYNDSGFTSALVENSQVIVPDYIFGQVKLDKIPSAFDDFVVQMEDCWATRTDNSSGVPSYPIIENGCKAPPSGSEPSDKKEILQNYEANCAAFKFQSFLWTNFIDAEQAIYVHCDITICQNSTGLCPGKNCVERKRRALGENDYHRLSAGPFRMVKTESYDGDDVEDEEVLEENVDLSYIAAFALIAVLLLLIIYVLTAILAKKM